MSEADFVFDDTPSEILDEEEEEEEEEKEEDVIKELMSRHKMPVYKIRKSLADYAREELEQLGRKSYYQRIFVLARNVEESSDLREQFIKDIDEIIQHCYEERYDDEEKVTGLFLYMQSYSLMVVEGSEDIVAEFFVGLAKIENNFWSESRVFQILDGIGKTFFNAFVSCKASVMQISHKFTPSVLEDMEEMGKEHIITLEKLVDLCTSLSEQLGNEEICAEDGLSPEKYNKCLPEVQRIDLVLSSKFYRTVLQFSKIFGHIPMDPDEESEVWPIPYNFTPMGIFKRSPFDVNLTFPENDGEELKKLQALL